MKVGDRVMFARVVLADMLGVDHDAVGVVVQVHEHPVIPDYLDIQFPNRDMLRSQREDDFVEVNSLS